jgi:hypothetical protein
MGRPFAAVIKLTPEFKAEFDFGQDKGENGEPAAPADFTGKEPLGVCPKCGAHVFENGMNYICEKAARKEGCDFRTGKVILQRAIEPAQIQKLLTSGKTDLLDKFISKKGRPFKAYLVYKEGRVGFEFEPRPAREKTSAKKAAPAEKIDFTGRQPIAVCPGCGARVFETDSYYICEKSQADKKPCKFKVGRKILGKDIEPEEVQKLATSGRTDLIQGFMSKKGTLFPAFLVMEEGVKVGFEFPPRDA